MANLEENKELAREFFEQIWNQGDESAIDRFIAEYAARNDLKFEVGRESFRLQWRKWSETFPDVHFTVEEIVAEENSTYHDLKKVLIENGFELMFELDEIIDAEQIGNYAKI